MVGPIALYRQVDTAKFVVDSVVNRFIKHI